MALTQDDHDRIRSLFAEAEAKAEDRVRRIYEKLDTARDSHQALKSMVLQRHASDDQWRTGHDREHEHVAHRVERLETAFSGIARWGVGKLVAALALSGTLLVGAAVAVLKVVL